MIRALSVPILCAACCVAARGEEGPAAVAKRQANEVGVAVKSGDFGKVVDLTYPKVIEVIGGRERMTTLMEAGLKQMKEQGFAFRSYRIAEPSEILTEGENTFIVVPTTVEMTVPGGKAVARSYLLGISVDRGKTWKFVDGSGLKDANARDKVLPKLPAGLKLPEFQKPEMIKDQPAQP